MRRKEKSVWFLLASSTLILLHHLLVYFPDHLLPVLAASMEPMETERPLVRAVAAAGRGAALRSRLADAKTDASAFQAHVEREVAKQDELLTSTRLAATFRAIDEGSRLRQEGGAHAPRRTGGGARPGARATIKSTRDDRRPCCPMTTSEQEQSATAWGRQAAARNG